MVKLQEALDIMRQELGPWGERHGLRELWHSIQPGIAFVGIDFGRHDLLISFSFEKFEADISVTFYRDSLTPPATVVEREWWRFDRPKIDLSELMKQGKCRERHRRPWWPGFLRNGDILRRELRRSIGAV